MRRSGPQRTAVGSTARPIQPPARQPRVRRALRESGAYPQKAQRRGSERAAAATAPPAAAAPPRRPPRPLAAARAARARRERPPGRARRARARPRRAPARRLGRPCARERVAVAGAAARDAEPAARPPCTARQQPSPGPCSGFTLAHPALPVAAPLREERQGERARTVWCSLASRRAARGRRRPQQQQARGRRRRPQRRARRAGGRKQAPVRPAGALEGHRRAARPGGSGQRAQAPRQRRRDEQRRAGGTCVRLGLRRAISAAGAQQGLRQSRQGPRSAESAA